MTTETTTAAAKPAARKSRKVGTVVSNKMEKTVVVEVTRLVKHGRYGKFQKKSARFLADDREAFGWPDWCATASRTTDAHLLALAEANGAELATLDGGIPGAFVIPLARTFHTFKGVKCPGSWKTAP